MPHSILPSWVLPAAPLRTSPQKHSLPRPRKRPRPAPRATPRAASVSLPPAPPPPPPRGDAHAIRALPRAVVQHIAAGEVLRGLSCCVRELVENALDARARAVRVDVDPAARTLTCADDGRGMPAAALALAARCNATSKLRDVPGLAEVATLGFRGQGLWVLASVAGQGLAVKSRVCDADVGARVLFDGDGAVREASLCAMGVGTIVTATGLPWPCGSAEVRDARQWLERTALVWPRVAFSLSVKGKTLWRSAATSEGEDESSAGMQTAFATFVGRPQADFRRAAVADAAGLCGGVDVVVGVPARVHFGDGRKVVVAVNGRCVSLPDVERGVRAAFRSALPPRRYPAVFVRVTAARRGVCDWNISPVKSTMRLQGVDVSALVTRAIELALGSDFVQVDEESRAFPSEGAVAAASLQALGGHGAAVESLLARSQSSQKTLTALERSPEHEETLDADGEQLSVPSTPSMSYLKVVTQTLGTYILAEHDGSGLFLIEQHVAHERVLYEELVDTWASSFVALPVDRIIMLPAAVASDDERLLALSALGFDISLSDLPSGAIARITSVPRAVASLPTAELAAAVRAVATADDGGRHGVDSAAARLACRAAVRNGAPLSMRSMNGLVQRLTRCRNPHTCPHGRPIFLELGARDLAALFQRRYSPRARLPSRRRARGVL